MHRRWWHRFVFWVWRRFVREQVAAGWIGLRDWESNIWTIRGLRITDELIRGWATDWPVGKVVRLDKREDGVCTFAALPEDLCVVVRAETADAIAALRRAMDNLNHGAPRLREIRSTKE